MKKLISLLLTLALLSTMFVFGATSASAAVATTPAEEIVSPEVVYVNTAYTTETVTDDSTDPATETTHSIVTQTVKYYPNGTSQKLDYRYTSNKNWMYLKFPLNGLNSVTAVELYTYMRYNTQAAFYIRGLDESVWIEATTGLVENAKTLTTTDGVGDTLLNLPSKEGAVLDGLQISSTSSSEGFTFDGTEKSVSVTDNANTTRTGTTIGGELVSYINNAASAGEEYVYFVVSFYPTQNKAGKGCQFDATKASFTLTGTKAIEGLGTKIMVEKEASIYFTDTNNIGYVGKDTTTGEGLEGNQATGAGDYILTTNASMNKDDRLYLRADLSAYAEKEITKVEFKVYNRQHRSGCKTYIARTDATWIADGENEISYANQPAVDSTVSEMRFYGSSSSNATTTADITSLVENLGTAHNNVLSLRFRSNVYESSDTKAATFFNVGEATGARIVVTYLDELEAGGEIPAAKTFKFKGEVTTEDAQVRLLVGIYDSTGALIDVVASDVLTNGTDTLELPVDLSAYADAASVQGFFWDGTTLNPFMEPTTANVAAAA